ncbi:MAG: histone deacetylase family protein [Chloroflexota bacterium]
MLALSLPAACSAKAAPAPTPKAGASGGLTPSATGIKVIFHPDYLLVYSFDPAAEAGRIQAILQELQGFYEFVKPEPAKEEDIRAVHTQSLIGRTFLDPGEVLAHGAAGGASPFTGELYRIAPLAAGGAILAAELAVQGQVTFALIRPPGSHASADSSYGHCYLNNIAIAVAKLLDEKKIERALIVDFDVHPGDGTEAIFRDDGRVTFYDLPSELEDRTQQLESLEDFLKGKTDYDILAVSAGFDGAKEEGGAGVLETEDFTTIGRLLKEAAERNSGGKRFAVLEGGYNQQVLGKNVKAFLEGFE